MIGAGHGGKAMAAHLALMDFPTTLYNRTPERIAAIKELGGITVSIPMVNSLRSLIERYIKENIKEIPIKKIARELGMNERAVANIMRKKSLKIDNGKKF